MADRASCYSRILKNVLFSNNIIRGRLDRTLISVSLIILSSASFKLNRGGAGSKLGAFSEECWERMVLKDVDPQKIVIHLLPL